STSGTSASGQVAPESHPGQAAVGVDVDAYVVDGVAGVQAEAVRRVGQQRRRGQQRHLAVAVEAGERHRGGRVVNQVGGVDLGEADAPAPGQPDDEPV